MGCRYFSWSCEACYGTSEITPCKMVKNTSSLVSCCSPKCSRSCREFHYITIERYTFHPIGEASWMGASSRFVQNNSQSLSWSKQVYVLLNEHSWIKRDSMH